MCRGARAHGHIKLIRPAELLITFPTGSQWGLIVEINLFGEMEEIADPWDLLTLTESMCIDTAAAPCKPVTSPASRMAALIQYQEPASAFGKTATGPVQQVLP